MSTFAFSLEDPEPDSSASDNCGGCRPLTRSKGRKSASPVITLPLKQQYVRYQVDVERSGPNTFLLAVQAYVYMDAKRYLDEELNRRLYPDFLPPLGEPLRFRPAKAIRLLEVDMDRHGYSMLLVQEGERLEFLVEYHGDEVVDAGDLTVTVRIFPRYDLDEGETYFRLCSQLSQLVGGRRFLCRPRVAMAAIQRYVRQQKLETKKCYLILDARLRFIYGQSFVKKHQLYVELLKALEEYNLAKENTELRVEFSASRHSRLGLSAKGGKSVMIDSAGLMLPDGWQPSSSMSRNSKGKMQRAPSTPFSRTKLGLESSPCKGFFKLKRTRSCMNIAIPGRPLRA